MPALPWVAPREDKPPVRRDPPRPPGVCEHDAAAPAHGICTCTCRTCWNVSRSIGDRCVDPQCTLHHPPAPPPE